jgi:two-component sensor histidine kinase
MIGEESGEKMIDRELGFRIHEDDRARIIEGLRSRLAGKETPAADDFRVIGPDGKPFWVSSSSSLISYRGRPANLALISDIDERKRQQERIEKLLAEKELLLREVNHRVKNNLGVAISLLSLHAEAVEGRPTRDVLAEAQAMLATMSELYESLHRAGSSGTLSIRDYLPSLVDEVAQLFPMNPPVRFELDLEDIRLDARVLSPLGIILNEIMTNSLRHAFSGIDAPAIRISARMRDGLVCLECADNGRGLPPGFDPADSQGFGAALILALAAQLGATWRVESGTPGTSWRLDIPFEASSR